MITSIVAFAIRLALVGAMTFGFVVLFEHGPSNYLQNMQADFFKFLELTSQPVPAAAGKSPNSGT